MFLIIHRNTSTPVELMHNQTALISHILNSFPGKVVLAGTRAKQKKGMRTVCGQAQPKYARTDRQTHEHNVTQTYASFGVNCFN